MSQEQEKIEALSQEVSALRQRVDQLERERAGKDRAIAAMAHLAATWEARLIEECRDRTPKRNRLTP